MFSLGFYPEYDSHHAIFRALCISQSLQTLTIPVFRIVDYYFLHPYDLRSFRLAGATQRKIAANYENLRPYKRVAEPASVAIYMWQFQQTALTALARRRMIDPGAFGDVVRFSPSIEVSTELHERIAAEVEAKAEVVQFLNSV